MPKGGLHVPSGIYRFLPGIYLGCGIVTIPSLPNVYGVISGVLFIGAGLLTFLWRGRSTPRRHNKSNRRRSSRAGAAELRWEDQFETRRTGSTPSRQSVSESDDIHEEPDSTDSKDVPSDEVRVEYHDGDTVTPDLLARFSPFNRLEDSMRERIADELLISKMATGETLLEQGSLNDVSVYLVQGTLILRAADGRKVTVKDATRGARRPIGQLRPHVYTVTAGTDVAVILASQEMVRNVTQQISNIKRDMDIQVHERNPN